MANKVKVVIAFDRDASKIGKTIEVDKEQARILIAEGRAHPANKEAEKLGASGPTVKPPLPQVSGTAADVVALQDSGQLSDAANAQERDAEK